MIRESPPSRLVRRRQLLLVLVVALALFLALIASAFQIASRHARAQSAAAADQAVHANEGLLSSELQKFRLLPVVLAEYPDVREALLGRAAPATARLNSKLEILAARTDAAAIYVIARDGRTVAASNWRLPTSFVGHDYGFRPYFRDAMRSGNAELFALGTVSARPGLFIARRMTVGGAPIGVVVVKVEFDKLEGLWARQPATAFVVDRNGVVIITSRPAWRFRTTRPLSSGQAGELQRSLQFGRARLQPLDIDLVGKEGEPVRDSGGTEFVPASTPTALDAARLYTLQPLEPARAAAYSSARAAILGGLVLLVLLAGLVFRALERRLMREEATRSLEREVASRTAELREANSRLQAEYRERERVAARYREAREELAQANRLSSIGQIVAGVVHEINQPVAAIRTFADNARHFLARGVEDQAVANLSTISELTERIGRITAELRAFARRRTPSAGPIRLAEVIEGALLLVGDGLAGKGVALERAGDGEIRVVADRVRLEQILINLLQNAAEALAGRPDARIRLGIAPEGEKVHVDVTDNGPGISPDLRDQLFTPFVTGRDDGLGLGLAIARDIARELGGELELISAGGGSGAAFRLTLRRA